MHRPNMVDTYQPKTVDYVTFCLVAQLPLITYFCKMSVNHGPRPIYDRLDGNCSIANLMFHAAILTLCANKRTLNFSEVVRRGHIVEHYANPNFTNLTKNHCFVWDQNYRFLDGMEENIVPFISVILAPPISNITSLVNFVHTRQLYLYGYYAENFDLKSYVGWNT